MDKIKITSFTSLHEAHGRFSIELSVASWKFSGFTLLNGFPLTNETDSMVCWVKQIN